MNSKLKTLDLSATTLIGLNADFYGAMSPKFNGQDVLGPLWAELFSKLQNLSLAYQGKMIAVTRPATSGVEGLLNQFVGMVVDEIPSDLQGLEVFKLEPMRLATYEHRGSMHGLVDSIKEFYGEVLPSSGYVQPKPWSLELEIYGEDYDPKNPDAVMLIATPILAN